MQLDNIWFVIVAIFWVGFFILEGFDFGVGMLHSFVGRNDVERRIAVNSIGPNWDGNEMWLVIAAAATFAAFPGWYATMFSTFYLVLLIVLVALIGRGVSFEFQRKTDNPRWRATWRWSLTIGSALIPLLLGTALGDLLHGLPINSDHNYTGSFWGLLVPYGLYTGITLTVLSLFLGATFLTLKTDGATAPALRPPLRPARLAGRRGRLRLADLEPRRPQRRLRPQPHRRPGLDRHRGGGLAGRIPRPGLGLHRRRHRHRQHRRVHLLRPVPPGHGVEHQRHLQPHHRQLGQPLLHPHGHDRGRGHLLTRRARLPGLELLGVPQTAHLPPNRRHPPSRAAR